MTVPPRGVAARCLLDRFATATDCRPASGTLGTSPWATSRCGPRGRGRPEAQRCPRPAPEPERVPVRRQDGLRPRLAVARPRPLRLPAELERLRGRAGSPRCWCASSRGAGSSWSATWRACGPRGAGRVLHGRPFDEVTDGRLPRGSRGRAGRPRAGARPPLRRYRRAFPPGHRKAGDPRQQEVMGSAARAAGSGCGRRRTPTHRPQPAAGPGGPRLRRPDIRATYAGRETDPGSRILVNS